MFTKPHRYHKMLPTVTDVLQSVCLCWSQPQAVLKWLFGVWTWVGQEIMYRWGPRPPEEGAHLGHLSAHCIRNILHVVLNILYSVGNSSNAADCSHSLSVFKQFVKVFQYKVKTTDRSTTRYAETRLTVCVTSM